MPHSAHTVAAVSFLNARPLVDGIEDRGEISLITDVPSRLLETLLSGQAQVALCPVIDFQLADTNLCIVPAGAIGSDGPTHTVRVFSRVPIKDLQRVHTDADSHTSVALLGVVLDALNGRRPEMVTLADQPAQAGVSPEALLLIGDKVVRNEPDPALYPFQLDLGSAWKDLTGLPFVFAVWLARVGEDLGDLPGLLRRCRERNLPRISEIVSAHAEGWPVDLARRYLGEILQYRIGDREFQAIELFWKRCHALGLIDDLRPSKIYDSAQF